MKMKAMKIGAVVLGYIATIAIFTLAEIGAGTILEFYTGRQSEASWAYIVEYAAQHSWYIPSAICVFIAGVAVAIGISWRWIKK